VADVQHPQAIPHPPEEGAQCRQRIEGGEPVIRVLTWFLGAQLVGTFRENWVIRSAEKRDTRPLVGDALIDEVAGMVRPTVARDRRSGWRRPAVSR
jgi:hypothetical protein